MEVEKASGIASLCPPWKDICDLPYLDACILEDVRLHPPFCLPLNVLYRGAESQSVTSTSLKEPL